MIIANVYQVPVCVEGTEVSASRTLAHYPHNNLWSGYYDHACSAGEETDPEGLRGWLSPPLLSGAPEMESWEPGSKVSAYSWFLSPVFSANYINYIVGSQDTCPKEITRWFSQLT